MRTAIVSDLHLGSNACKDLLRDAEIRQVFLNEIGSADRLVLLGDVLELFELSQSTVLRLAQPFFEELGNAMAGRDIVLVPGNHDYLLAEPLLAHHAAQGQPLGLEQHVPPRGNITPRIASLLGTAKLDIAYPGVWLRDDVYVTHGHYMDCHRTLVRMECILPAMIMRAAGSVPPCAEPADYERVLRPIYQFGFSLAQLGLGRWATRWLASAWRAMAGREGKVAQNSAVSSIASAGTWALNGVLRANFCADFSGSAIYRSSFDGGATLVERLQIEAAHTIMGHSHWGGPRTDEQNWVLWNGGCLHNSASWVFDPAFQSADAPPLPNWPGTVIWLEEQGPPKHKHLLRDYPLKELAAAVDRIACSA
jgi:hypothetical protein